MHSPKKREAFANLGLRTPADLLLHLPTRWEDRSVTPLRDAATGGRVQVEGQVLRASLGRGRRRMLLAQLQDRDGEQLTLMFFHFSRPQRERLKPGIWLRCFGTVRRDGQGRLSMVHPEYRQFEPGAPAEEEAPEELLGVYPKTEALGQWDLRNAVSKALELLEGDKPPPDPLRDLVLQGGAPPPAEDGDPLQREQAQLALDEALELLRGLQYGEALRLAHRPPVGDVSQAERAATRLALEELVANWLVRRSSRRRARKRGALAMDGGDELVAKFLESLPFAPTGAQRRVVAEIQAAMRSPEPMLRLLQGDVGSGKSAVAAAAALQAIGSGRQATVLAPTEVLAEQHLATMRAWLEPLGVRVAGLSSSTAPKLRDSILESLHLGEIDLLIGTHALLEPRVRFAKLGVMVVDEQHRFGVQQRLRLLAKASGGDGAEGGGEGDGPGDGPGDSDGPALHQLTMTATPIPRTLAMTMYADMDVSTIDEMPPGRLPVRTSILAKSRRDALLQRLRQRLDEGEKVFWICTLVEESEEFDAADVHSVVERLRGELPEQLGIGMLHGRMKPEEKRQAMDEFRAGKTRLLVATTVVEVGVDVPDAGIMVIEDPERLGLAQLHQLRGRVGRGGQQAYCLLLYDDGIGERGRERLGVLCENNSGFVIAEEDMRLRGMGELHGARQHGGASFRVADLQRDRRLVPAARDLGARLHEADPRGEEVLVQRWLGSRDHYTAA